MSATYGSIHSPSSPGRQLSITPYPANSSEGEGSPMSFEWYPPSPLLPDQRLLSNPFGDWKPKVPSIFNLRRGLTSFVLGSPRTKLDVSHPRNPFGNPPRKVPSIFSVWGGSIPATPKSKPEFTQKRYPFGTSFPRGPSIFSLQRV